MLAKRSGRCFRCGIPYGTGTPIRPRVTLAGFAPDGKRLWKRWPGEYVHEKCPKVERKVDLETGEIA